MAWQSATLARQLLPAEVAEAALAGRSPDLLDLSCRVELGSFV